MSHSKKTFSSIQFLAAPLLILTFNNLTASEATRLASPQTELPTEGAKESREATEKNLARILELWSKNYCAAKGVTLKWIDVRAARRKVKENEKINKWKTENNVEPKLSHLFYIDYTDDAQKDESEEAKFTKDEEWIENINTGEMQTPTLQRKFTLQSSYSLSLGEALKVGARVKLAVEPPFGKLETELNVQCDFTSQESIRKTQTTEISYGLPSKVPNNTIVHATLEIVRQPSIRHFTLTAEVTGYFVIAYKKKAGLRTYFYVVPIYFPFTPSTEFDFQLDSHETFSTANRVVSAEVLGTATGQSCSSAFVTYRGYDCMHFNGIAKKNWASHAEQESLTPHTNESTNASVQVTTSQAGNIEQIPWESILPENMLFDSESSEDEEEKIDVEFVE